MTESIRERATDAGVSEETLKVLEAVRRDGETFEGVDKPEEKPEVKPEQKEEPKVDPKPEAPKEEPKEEPKVEKPSQPEERPARFVPVKKFNEQRHELGETKAQLEAERAAKLELENKLKGLSDKPTTKEIDDVRVAARTLAEKHQLDEEFITDLMDKAVEIATRKAGKNNTIPDDIAKTISEFKEQTARNKEIEQAKIEDEWFENSFSSVSKEFPELADPKVKNELKQLAFTEGYESTPLRALALEYIHDNKPRKTAESTGTGRADITDYESMTEEELKKMSREEYAKYADWFSKKHDWKNSKR